MDCNGGDGENAVPVAGAVVPVGGGAVRRVRPDKGADRKNSGDSYWSVRISSTPRPFIARSRMRMDVPGMRLKPIFAQCFS